MVKPVQYGRTERVTYSKIDEIIDIPNLLEIQKESYRWFIEEGLMEVLEEAFNYRFSGDIELSLSAANDIDNPTYSVEECKERDANYVAKLYVHVRLHTKVNDVIKDQSVYMVNSL